jgi:hypothetical protein
MATHLKDKPAGSRCISTAIVDGVDLQAIGYKYNKRRVLFFVATVGAGSVRGGVPYTQRWANEYMNVTTRDIPRPDLVSLYFSRSPKVDNYYQSRQHDLMLEELWFNARLLVPLVHDLFRHSRHRLLEALPPPHA